MLSTVGDGGSGHAGVDVGENLAGGASQTLSGVSSIVHCTVGYGCGHRNALSICGAGVGEVEVGCADGAHIDGGCVVHIGSAVINCRNGRCGSGRADADSRRNGVIRENKAGFAERAGSYSCVAVCVGGLSDSGAHDHQGDCDCAEVLHDFLKFFQIHEAFDLALRVLMWLSSAVV